MLKPEKRSRSSDGITATPASQGRRLQRVWRICCSGLRRADFGFVEGLDGGAVRDRLDAAVGGGEEPAGGGSAGIGIAQLQDNCALFCVADHVKCCGAVSVYDSGELFLKVIQL